MLKSHQCTRKVMPIFQRITENYRPVSLTRISCNILEQYICKHILDHLDRYNIITSLHHGFRLGYSCETQLGTTVHDLLGKFDSGSQIDMNILDFSKAFDTVLHSKLLHKIKLYDGNINAWLSDFKQTER